VNEGVVAGPIPGVNDLSRRFVDGDQFFVFVEDVHWHWMGTEPYFRNV
jgi:hypothetical protein